MKTPQEIRAEIKRIKSDDRLKRKPALVQINAPLALVQVDLNARIQALQWVLKTVKVD